jgi:hypothetical protein
MVGKCLCWVPSLQIGDDSLGLAFDLCWEGGGDVHLTAQTLERVPDDFSDCGLREPYGDDS